MFYLFFTIPADRGQEGFKKQRPKGLSRNQAIFTWVLLLLWLILMSFGIISTINPEWLKNLSYIGVKVESRDYKNYGDSFLNQRNYKQAIIQYKQALKIKPDYVGALINLAVAYIHLGDEKQAAQMLMNALQMQTSQKGVIYYNLGELLEKQEKWDEAIRYYEKAIGSEFEQGLIYRKLGTLYLAIGQYEKAKKAFEMTLADQLDPCTSYKNMLRKSIAVFENDTINLPIIKEQLARDIHPEDLASYDLEIIRLLQKSDPEIAKTHNHLGLIYARLGDVNKAIEHFQKSLQIWPGNLDARKNLQLLQRIQEK